MTSKPSSQTMKAATAAKKLGIYLPAAPQEFQDALVSREELTELQTNPPQWLADLRQHGPHPRSVVAARLGVSISGLVRAGYTEPLTTAEVAELREQEPDWLVRERDVNAQVRAEEDRIAEQQAKAAKVRAQRERGKTPKPS